MSLYKRFLGSSVGRKAIMALSGLGLCAFLVVHLIGNVALLFNKKGVLSTQPSRAFFDGVVDKYHAIPTLLFVLEVGLAALFLLHIILGITLWLKNRSARGERYAISRSEGGRTLGSMTMPITGVFLILAFLILHLLNFRLGYQTNAPKEMFGLVVAAFNQGWLALAYMVALLGLLLHLSHGFQSSFQSLGLHHPKHSPRLKVLGWLFALLLFVGFGSMPLLYFFAEVKK